MPQQARFYGLKEKNGKEYLVMNRFQHDEKFCYILWGLLFQGESKKGPSIFKRDSSFDTGKVENLRADVKMKLHPVKYDLRVL